MESRESNGDPNIPDELTEWYVLTPDYASEMSKVLADRGMYSCALIKIYAASAQDAAKRYSERMGTYGRVRVLPPILFTDVDVRLEGNSVEFARGITVDSQFFRLYSRGPQWWEWLDVDLQERRLTLLVDGRAISLTKIQTEELAIWLGQQLGGERT